MRAGQAASMRTEPHPSFQNVMNATLAANKGHFMGPAQLAELAEAQIAAQVLHSCFAISAVALACMTRLCCGSCSMIVRTSWQMAGPQTGLCGKTIWCSKQYSDGSNFVYMLF